MTYTISRYLGQLLAAGALVALAACSPSKPQTAAIITEDISLPDDVPAGAYTIDKAHTSLVFRIDHMSFSNFTGRFTRVDANLQLDPANLRGSSVQVTVDPTSIASDNAPDGFLGLLTSAEWLNTAQFQDITFRSTNVEQTVNVEKAISVLRITGDLTLHGVTRPIVLEATLNGGYAGHPMDPHARIGFSAHGTFKRSDFGVSIGLPPPGTTMGLGDDIDVVIETELSGPAWKRGDANTGA